MLLARQKSSCRFTGLVFHSGAPRGFAKNSSNCAVVVHSPSASIGPLSPSPRLQNRDRKPRVHDSTAPVISLLEATLNRKHPEASQETEMVEFLPRLQLQRWAAEARDVRVDAFFGVITFCRIPDGTRITRPFVVWFPACVVQGRTFRKVVVSVRPTDVLITCARSKVKKLRRPIAQPLPFWDQEPKWRQCLVH